MNISQNDVIDYDSYQMSLDYWKYEITKDEKYIKKYKISKDSFREKGDFKGFDELQELKFDQHMHIKEGEKYGGYTMIPHILYREVFPKILKRYRKKGDPEKLRSAFHLLIYLHSMCYGGGNDERYDKRLYGWAFPANKQIIENTGIGKDQLKERKDILQKEGLLKVVKVKSKNGRPKDYYLPFYYPFQDSEDEKLLNRNPNDLT
ncbi:MAG: hypothetical protein ACQEWV_06665 [Bacillota bacterium]